MPIPVQATATSALEDIASLLNTKYTDNYVFSGNTGQTAPVDLSDTDHDPTTGSADTDYYQGSGTLSTVMVDSDSGKTYGVTAGNTAFEQTLRALSMLSTMTTDLGTIQETLSRQTDALDTVIDNQTEFQLYANEALESLTSVDVAEASAIVSQQEVLLQASFATLSSLKSISVLDYL